MKIKFTKLPTTDGTIKVSLDGGQSFTDYNVVDVHESGIPLEDNQDYEKIQVKAPANVLKNLDIVASVKVEGGEGGTAGTGSTNESGFIIDTDTYGFDFPKCVTGIVLPNCATTINGNMDDSFFRFFPNLQTIIIPDSVTTIGNYAFKGCKGLTSITIPDSVTTIGNYAFTGCSGLTSVTIPDSVTSIGNYAFYGCSGLTSITIPESVTTIDSYAFSNCYGLTSITIPDSVTSIGKQAFYNCISLTSIIIPESVTTINSQAFQNCSDLTSVTIPDSVTSIGNYAFYGCTRLKTINYTGTEEQWNAINKISSWRSGCPSDMVINYNYTGE